MGHRYKCIIQGLQGLQIQTYLKRDERPPDGTSKGRADIGSEGRGWLQRCFSYENVIHLTFVHFPVKISPSKVLPKELNLVSSSGFISRIIIFPGVMIANIHF